MLFRLSQRLAQKFTNVPKLCALPEDNPYADWSAHLFTARRNEYVLLTNTPTFYSMVMLGKGIVDDRTFRDAALSCMREFMCEDGIDFIFWRFVEPTSQEALFSTVWKHSVARSVAYLTSHATFYLSKLAMPPSEVSSQLNNVPLGILGYRSQREVFKGMVAIEPQTR